MQQDHLGAEYFNVAKAIQKGRGFSDPFEDETGPTAWVTPMLPSLMACVLFLTNGSKTDLAVLFILVNLAILSLTGTIVLHIGRKTGNVTLAALSLALVYCCNFKWLFQMTHDPVFHIFWVNLVFLGLWRFRDPPRSKLTTCLWGMLGGLCALCSPVIGFMWAVATTFVWGLPCWRQILVVAVVSITTVSPWVAYQSVRLGEFTPIKSNSAFELFQGQAVLPDGLVIRESYPLHPYSSSSDEGIQYRELGEANYLKEIREKAMDSVKENPVGYLRRVANRFCAATFLLHFESQSDKIVFPNLFCEFAFSLSFFGLITVLLDRSYSKHRWVIPLVVCYFVYLFPYVAVSYYERYGVPLTLARTLFTFLFLVWLKNAALTFIARPPNTD